MRCDYDLIIVGGGLAGNCLALALKDSGLRLALIEAETPAEREHAPIGQRALALAYGSTVMLAALGVWETIKKTATPIKHIHVSDQGHFGKTRLSADKEGVDALGYVITARHIESHVSEQASKTALTTYCPARVVGLISSDEAAYVNLNVDQQSVNLTAKLVIGADGGQSTVRQLLAIEQKTTDYFQKAIVTTVRSSLGHNNVAYERFTAEGPLAVLPATGNHSSVVWTRTTEHADDLIQRSDADFLAELQNCFGFRMGSLQLVGPRFAFPVNLIRAEKMVQRRAIIVGNAAHQLHPVAGQGFNLGLRDVLQLAEMLIEQVENEGDIGEPAFLDSYAKARQIDHDKVINFTDGLVRVFSNDWLPVTISRNTALILLDHVNSVKSLVTQHAMGLGGRLQRLGKRRY